MILSLKGICSTNEEVQRVADLTYTPSKPSTFREDEESEEEKQNLSDDDENEDTTNSRTGNTQYNLRNIDRVQYNQTEKSFSAIVDPDCPTVSQALNGPDKESWIKGINDEFETLTAPGTRDNDTPYIRREELLSSSVTLKLKRDKNGNPARYKGRVVAHGNHQDTSTILPSELYVPVACINLVLLLLTIGLAFGWDIQHVHVKGAFLYSILPAGTHIWIRLPKIQGVKWTEGRIVKLRKSLYGLKQAPVLWYKHLTKALHSIGLQKLNSTESLFLKRYSTGIVIILVYVDELLIMGYPKSVPIIKEK